MSANFSRVPVVDVSAENLETAWPLLLDCTQKASFIAIDTELSGIGERRKLMTQSVEDRYKYICEVAKTRSILSLGVSFFVKKQSTCQPDPAPVNEPGGEKEPCSPCEVHFQVQTFNIWVLCMDNFVVEPASLKFLVDHGFDFNKQYSQGIPFARGLEKVSHNFQEITLRNLFLRFVLSHKPVVVHNGLLDLVFLYQNFYGELPTKLQVFTADLAEMFPGGVLDTKYVAEFHAREPASYLGYIFKKSQRRNMTRCSSGQSHVVISTETLSPVLAWTEDLSCSTQTNQVNPGSNSTAPCLKYMAHGFCPQGKECLLSHDLDVILDHEELLLQVKRKKRKRKKKHPKTDDRNQVLQEMITDDHNQVPQEMPSTEEKPHLSEPQIPSLTSNQTEVKTRNCGHRAGFDAFMTGYCLATYLVQCGSLSANETALGLSTTEFSNKVSLSGKEVPLQIICSHFARPSAAHTEKLCKAREVLGITT